MPPLLGLTAVAVLVLANGFFVAAESAMVAARRSRLEQLAAEGRRSAQVAREMVRRVGDEVEVGGRRRRVERLRRHRAAAVRVLPPATPSRASAWD